MTSKGKILLIAGLCLCIATPFLWKPVYYDIYLINKYSKLLGITNSIRPWDIDRRYLDGSLDGEVVYWYLSIGEPQVPLASCRPDRINLHTSMSDLTIAEGCKISTLTYMTSECSGYVLSYSRINNFGDVLYAIPIINRCRN